MQFGFIPRKGMQERFLVKKKALINVFLDLEEAFDKLPREVVWWTLKKLGVEYWLMKDVMTMYDNVRITVKTKYGSSEEFKVKVGYIRERC